MDKREEIKSLMVVGDWDGINALLEKTGPDYTTEVDEALAAFKAYVSVGKELGYTDEELDERFNDKNKQIASMLITAMQRSSNPLMAMIESVLRGGGIDGVVKEDCTQCSKECPDRTAPYAGSITTQ